MAAQHRVAAVRVVLETPRLALREMTGDDHRELAAMLRDPEVMYAWEKCFSDDEIAAWIDRNRLRYRHNNCGYWLAVDKASGRVVGQAGLIREEIWGHTHLGAGWILKRACWGRGYASEAARGCLAYAFDALGAPRVVADIRPENTASVRVAERLGMQPGGLYDKPVGGGSMPHRVYGIASPRVEVCDYDPEWPRHFEGLAAVLRPALAGLEAKLEHVGSTAVPGLAAKPVIDADIALADRGVWPVLKARLEALGFFHRGDLGLPGREAFTDSLRFAFRVNLYAGCRDCQPIANHLLLRDYLRAHGEAAARYGALKRRLARRFSGDIDAYCSRKSALIAEFLAAAGMDAGEIAAIRRLNGDPEWT